MSTSDFGPPVTRAVTMKWLVDEAETVPGAGLRDGVADLGLQCQGPLAEPQCLWSLPSSAWCQPALFSACLSASVSVCAVDLELEQVVSKRVTDASLRSKIMLMPRCV
ncbi:hypothetical protein Asi02nite_65740 [Asanoa siamensis]|uniref:Uncharacterized protein n=1 Tax=Asanoa siamensis TaxID=926357 RepID=A0ABQ4D0H7_9ACTN|nr:hypothetical protein Asi02nite_65740 [Asanoa siamensis]